MTAPACGWRRAVALLSAACCVTGCGRPDAEEVLTRTVVPVTVATAQVGRIQAVIRTTGMVAPAPGADFVVTAPAPARIAAIPKAEGDVVRRGELLARFEIPSLGAEAATRRADVDRAHARLQNARAAQARARDLFERGVAARKDVEEADRERAEAEAALEEAEAGRTASTALAARSIVRAPFDGIIARRTKNPGDLVDTTSSEPILRVVDPRRLEVHASVPIADVPRVVLGAPAHASVSPATAPEALKVVSHPAAVEPGTAAAAVRLAFVSPPRFAVGTPVQVSIDAEEHDRVVLVPAAAVVREANQTTVMLVGEDSKAHRQIVTVGLSNGSFVEITSGVKAGARVIVRGQNGLPDGAPVAVSG